MNIAQESRCLSSFQMFMTDLMEFDPVPGIKLDLSWSGKHDPPEHGKILTVLTQSAYAPWRLNAYAKFWTM